MGNAPPHHCPHGTVSRVEMIEMAWDDEAWGGFWSTKSSSPGLYAQLYAVLARIAGDPGAHDLRRRRLQDPSLFVITVTSGDESSAILWNQAEDGVAQVWFVGPSPF